MQKKVAIVSVIGPKPTSPHFPQDLELHKFARTLLEEANKNIHFEWYLGSHEKWAIANTNGPRVKHIEFDSSMIEELKYEHPSLDHGSMLNALLRKIECGFDFIVILDPDCFVIGEGNFNSLLSTMERDGIAVAGTPYGMQFPKGYFRDFPAAFFMVFATKFVDVSQLDFRITHEFDNSYRGKIRPKPSGESHWKRKVMDVLRLQVASLLKFAFGLDNPIRWWGFLDEFKSRAKLLPIANDTGFKVRETMKDSLKHFEFCVVQRTGLASEARGKAIASRKGNESEAFGGSWYFRNHGVFEGWNLIKFDFRAWIMFGFVVSYLRKVPRIELRFPISSMIQVEKTTDPCAVKNLFQRFSEIDIWSFNEAPIAIHLGYGTKNSLAKTGDWPALMGLLSDLHSKKVI